MLHPPGLRRWWICQKQNFRILAVCKQTEMSICETSANFIYLLGNMGPQHGLQNDRFGLLLKSHFGSGPVRV